MKKIMKICLFSILFLTLFFIAKPDALAAMNYYSMSKTYFDSGNNIYMKSRGFVPQDYSRWYIYNNSLPAYCMTPSKYAAYSVFVKQTYHPDLKACAKEKKPSYECGLASILQHGFNLEFDSKVSGSSNEKYGGTLYALRLWKAQKSSIDGGSVFGDAYKVSSNIMNNSKNYQQYNGTARNTYNAFYHNTSFGWNVLTNAFNLYKGAMASDIWYPDVTVPSEIKVDKYERNDVIEFKFTTTFDAKTKIEGVSASNLLDVTKFELKAGQLIVTTRLLKKLTETTTVTFKVKFVDPRNLTDIKLVGSNNSQLQEFIVAEGNNKTHTLERSAEITVPPSKINCNKITPEDYSNGERITKVGKFNLAVYNALEIKRANGNVNFNKTKEAKQHYFSMCPFVCEEDPKKKCDPTKESCNGLPACEEVIAKINNGEKVTQNEVDACKIPFCGEYSCGSVGVEHFKENGGAPKLVDRGDFKEGIYSNLVGYDSQNGTSYASYYFEACKNVTCENYDKYFNKVHSGGSEYDINPGGDMKFNESTFKNLPPASNYREKYVAACPTTCDYYTDDIYRANGKITKGIYNERIYNALTEEGAKEVYLAACNPCNPKDPSCSLPSACPPNSGENVEGSFKSSGIIDLQACAQTAIVDDDAAKAEANNSGFILFNGDYCSAACTYDVNVSYPGTRIGLGIGSGTFLEINNFKMDVKATCTTSAINYGAAITALENSGNDGEVKKVIVEEINKCLDLSKTIESSRPKPVVSFKYDEPFNHSGFDYQIRQGEVKHYNCRTDLVDNDCKSFYSTNDETITIPDNGNDIDSSILKPGVRVTTTESNFTYNFMPKTIFYSNYSNDVLSGDAGKAAAEAGKAVLIGTDGRVFPIGFSTEPGTYEYVIAIDKFGNPLLDYLKENKANNCSFKYKCNYNIHKYECEEPCPPDDDSNSPFTFGIDADFRFASNISVNPNDRALGANWMDDKGQATIAAIEALGDDVYKEEHLEYKFVLTPALMKKIRTENAKEEANKGGFANESLKCHTLDGSKYYYCESEWFNAIGLNRSEFQMKTFDIRAKDVNNYQVSSNTDNLGLFATFNGEPWK